MKKTVLSLVVAAICACSVIGCRNEKINVIHNDNVITNTVPMKAFQDENYIWENWQYGTNRANSAEIK